MKKVILIIVCILVNFHVFSQTAEVNVDSLLQQESVIWNQLMNEEITTEQWYQQKLNLGHYDNGIKAWFEYKNSINILNRDYKHLLDTKAILLVIPNDYQIEWPNGNKFIKIYLLNLTDSTLKIPRIDATIDHFSAEILIENEWIEFQTTLGSSCGNSYWTDKLDSKHVLEFQVGNDSLLVGDKSYKIRIVYDHFGTRFISNTVIAMLNSNQIARIKYQNVKTK